MNLLLRSAPLWALCATLSAQATLNLCVGSPPIGSNCLATFPQISDALLVAASAQPGSIIDISVWPGTYQPFQVTAAVAGRTVRIHGSDILNPPVVDAAGSGRCVTVMNAGSDIEISTLRLINGVAPSADPRGGGLLVAGTRAQVLRVRAESCSAFGGAQPGRGGGICIDDSATANSQLWSCTAVECDADSGGGYYITAQAANAGATLLGCLAERCDATSGGGYTIHACAAVLDGCVARDNDAFDLGGGYFLEAGSIGQPLVRMLQCEASQNRCLGGSGWGGGINVSGGFDVGGGDLFATLYQMNIVDNEATVGGGLWIGYQSVVTLDYANVARNEAAAQGGGLFGDLLRELHVANSTFDHNLAESGGGAYFGSGSGDAAPATCKCVLMVDNEATGTGGAVFLDHADVRFVACTVAGNIAPVTAVGGIDAVSSPAAVVDSSIVQQNSGIALRNVPAVTYCNVVGTILGATTTPGLLSVQQAFAPGPGVLPYQIVTNYYLQPGSVCIDSGNPAQSLLAAPFQGASTQVGTADALVLDMGFHYNGSVTPPLLSTLTSNVPATVFVPDSTVYTFSLSHAAAPLGTTSTIAVLSGSLTGTSPGTPLPPINVPLVFDNYSLLLASNPTVFSAALPTIQFVSVLGGTTTFAWTIAGITQLPGPQVFHAGFVMDVSSTSLTPRAPSLPLQNLFQ